VEGRDGAIQSRLVVEMARQCQWVDGKWVGSGFRLRCGG